MSFAKNPSHPTMFDQSSTVAFWDGVFSSSSLYQEEGLWKKGHSNSQGFKCFSLS